MIRHLLTSGYDLTACHLQAAIPGSLVSTLEKMNCRACRKALIRQGICPQCSDEGDGIMRVRKLTWSPAPRNKSGVANGRLTMNDVETIFYLGCDHCSETLISEVSPDEVAAALTAMAWRPE